MALTNTEGGENSSKINLKIKSVPWPLEDADRKKDAPHFAVLDEDFKESGEIANTVNGVVKSVYGSFTPAKGRMWDVYWFTTYIEDGWETYKIDSTINNLSKGLASILINNVGKDLTVKLYVNKNWYPSAYTTFTWDEETKVEGKVFEIDGEKISVFEKSKKGTGVTYEDIYNAIKEQEPVKKEEQEDEWINSEDIPF